MKTWEALTLLEPCGSSTFTPAPQAGVFVDLPHPLEGMENLLHISIRRLSSDLGH